MSTTDRHSLSFTAFLDFYPKRPTQALQRFREQIINVDITALPDGDPTLVHFTLPDVFLEGMMSISYLLAFLSCLLHWALFCEPSPGIDWFSFMLKNRPYRRMWKWFWSVWARKMQCQAEKLKTLFPADNTFCNSLVTSSSYWSSTANKAAQSQITHPPPTNRTYLNNSLNTDKKKHRENCFCVLRHREPIQRNHQLKSSAGHTDVTKRTLRER